MKHLLLTLPLIVLFSCKTPQTVTSVTKQQEQSSVATRISVESESEWREITAQELTRAINENLTVKIRQIKYDTSRPVDSLTNHPPVIEENDIVINKNTATDETEITNTDSVANNTTSYNDDSETKTEIQAATREKTKTGLNDVQKTLMIVGALTIIVVVIFIIVKIK